MTEPGGVPNVRLRRAFHLPGRAVYRTNDQRAAVKRRINDLLDARIIEEESYAPY